MSSEVAGYFERLRTHLRLGDVAESDDVMRELATHVEDRVDELVRRGMSPREATETTLRGFGRPRTLAHLLRQAHLATSWTDALLGAAAFVFLAVVLGGELWREPVLAAGSAALVVGITLYGLWQGRPSWFYPWAGAALTLPIAAGYIAFAVLHRGLPQLAYGADPLTLAGVAGALLYFPVGLFVVCAAVLVAVRRDWLDASVLLSPMPAMLVAVISIHRAGGISASGHALSDASPLLFGVYLSMGLATLALLRAPTRSLRIATLVGSAVVLLAVCTLLQDPGGGVVTLAARSALLVGFLLSPALVARHA
jgi:hypothetical protein